MAYCKALAYCWGVALAPLTGTIGDNPTQSATTSAAPASLRVTGLVATEPGQKVVLGAGSPQCAREELRLPLPR